MTFHLRAALAGLLFLAGAVAQEANPAGQYEGKILAPDREVNITVHLDRDAKQSWIGHITIVPGPSELPLSGIVVKGDTVSFTLSGIPNAPQFEGKWDKEAQTITGNVTSNNKPVPFELTRKGDPKVVLPKQSSMLPKELQGDWEGTLQAGGRTLRLVLALKPDAEGRAVATLVSVDQNNQPIPVTGFAIDGDAVSYEVKIIAGAFKGKVNADKTEIAGDWTQGPNKLPLTFKRKAAEPKK